MFLLSSAASLHGHEFSPVDNNPTPTARRNTLARAAFSTPLPRRNTTYAESTLPKSDFRPRLTRPLSDHIIQRVHEPVVRFIEPKVEAMSDDDRSVANSEGTLSTADGRKRRRRCIRTSTAFQLAHPAPTLTQKQRLLHVRPNLLLQLQQISSNNRPKPCIDVVPSTKVAPRLIKKFPRMFRSQGELGANDVIILKSEDYGISDTPSMEGGESDEEGRITTNREVIAAICTSQKNCGGASGKAVIKLADGTDWEATPVTNNLFEFVSIDIHGNTTTARWIKKKDNRKSGDLSEQAVNILDSEEFRFTFSIIDPRSRRHPIMASLTQCKLDIPDTYVSVSASSAMNPPTSSSKYFPEDPESPNNEEELTERTTHLIDESLRTLIQVTGVWVALRNGLSPYFKYSDRRTSLTLSASSLRAAHGRARSQSVTPDSLQHSPTMSTASTPDSRLLSGLGSKIRRSSVRLTPKSAASSICDTGSVPQRSISTGSTFMKRAAERKASGAIPSTVQSDSEGESSFGPPKRAATEGLATSRSRVVTPPRPLNLPGSASVTPEHTPTKPQRRAQSAYIPTSTLQQSMTNGNNERASLDSPNTSSLDESKPQFIVPKQKLSKWKSFTGLFKRGRRN